MDLSVPSLWIYTLCLYLLKPYHMKPSYLGCFHLISILKLIQVVIYICVIRGEHAFFLLVSPGGGLIATSWKFSETCMCKCGMWASFISKELNLWVSTVPFPLVQSLKKYSWDFNRTKIRAYIQIFILVR